ncbi:MAG: hypothetical protein O3C29_00405 [Proteobacteria bacterium]|jgi:hypothetical protein|nr:hypothetical protein [Pseudomonadota bacterium]MDA1290427.1 hypothetical protein [Pseudomonadota bacterium]
MNEFTFKCAMQFIALAFSFVFAVVVMPPLISSARLAQDLSIPIQPDTPLVFSSVGQL